MRLFYAYFFFLDASPPLVCRPLLSTLRQEHLTRTDFRNWSELVRPRLRTRFDTSCQVSYARIGPDYQHFPKYTCGFLYFHRPSFAPREAGEVRFRVVPSGDLEDFASGTDLRGYDGVMPYQISLVRIINSPGLDPVLEILKHDGIVSDFDIAAVRGAYSNSSRPSMDPVLYAYRQPFLMNLACHSRDFTLLTHEHNVLIKRMVHITHPGFSYYARHKRNPYSGEE